MGPGDEIEWREQAPQGDTWRAGVITGVLYVVAVDGGGAVAVPATDIRSAPRLPLETP